jgi:L-rhamnose mutarotase
MYLKEGCEEEYAKRYNALWPDLKELLKETGVVDFSIYWDRETNGLYAFQTFTKNCVVDSIDNNLIMQKWWEFMSDIVKVNTDNQPVVVPLDEMFHIDWLYR